MDDCEAEEEVAKINNYRQEMLKALTGAPSMLKTLINLRADPLSYSRESIRNRHSATMPSQGN